MKHLKSANYIGYALKDIFVTAQLYVKAGWELSEFFEGNVQNTKIASLKKDGLDASKSPVDNIISNNGVAPYHICYDVENIDQIVEDSNCEGFHSPFIPVSSVAMNSAKICYLYKVDIGLIEIVEKSI